MCELLHAVNVHHLVVGDFEVDALILMVACQYERSDAHCIFLRHGYFDAMIAIVPHQENHLIAWQTLSILVFRISKALVEVPRLIVNRAGVVVLLIAFLSDDLSELVVLFYCHSSLYNSTACEDNKAQAVESFNVYILVGRGQI